MCPRPLHPPQGASTPICAVMPKYLVIPLLVCFISGSRSALARSDPLGDQLFESAVRMSLDCSSLQDGAIAALQSRRVANDSSWPISADRLVDRSRKRLFAGAEQEPFDPMALEDAPGADDVRLSDV